MSYTQSPPLTDKEIDIFLKEAEIARICTLNKNGTIHAVPVWFKYEKGLFVVASPEKARKIRNISYQKTVLIQSKREKTNPFEIYSQEGKTYIEFIHREK